MSNEKYEPIKFDSWQELAKYVIDGGEVYYGNNRIIFNFKKSEFNYSFTDHLMENLFIEKQPTLEELIAIKPRLCWVWDDDDVNKKEVAVIKSVTETGRHEAVGWLLWDNAQMLTDDEIKQFLDKEPS